WVSQKKIAIPQELRKITSPALAKNVSPNDLPQSIDDILDAWVEKVDTEITQQLLSLKPIFEDLIKERNARANFCFQNAEFSNALFPLIPLAGKPCNRQIVSLRSPC